MGPAAALVADAGRDRGDPTPGGRARRGRVRPGAGARVCPGRQARPRGVSPLGGAGDPGPHRGFRRRSRPLSDPDRPVTVIVTLTTDFGLRDPYVAEMKGVILGI